MYIVLVNVHNGYTVKALLKVLLKNNYDPQRHLVWSEKKLEAPCLGRCLQIRAQLRPFQSELQQAEVKVYYVGKA